MKPRESTIQAKEFQAAALRRQLAQFERMIGDLETIRIELGKQIETEEQRTGITDPSNFAYSTVARAARDRRANLTATIEDLSDRRARALEEIGDLDSFFHALANSTEFFLAETAAPKHRTAAA